MKQSIAEDRIYTKKQTILKSTWTLFFYNNELIFFKALLNDLFILPLVCNAVPVIYQVQTHTWI